MRVSVRQEGGIFGINRAVEVADDLVTVTENGSARGIGPLEGDKHAEIDTLAEQVVQLSQEPEKRTGSPVSDEMATALEVEHGGRRKSFNIVSGDSLPTEVWRLVGAVSSLGQAS